MLLQDYKQKLQEEATKNLVGNYLRGAAENAAYLEGVSATLLGEMFLTLGESIDLSSRNLVDIDAYNDFYSAPVTGGTLSLLIKDINDKITLFTEAVKFKTSDNALAIKSMAEYAKEVVKGASIVAFSEGSEDIDLRNDIKVLLKQGHDEFNNRIKEELKEKQEEQKEQLVDPTAGAPMVSDGIEDDANFNDDASTEDTDYEAEANSLYGDDEEEPEDTEGAEDSEPVEEDTDDIPGGKSEAHIGDVRAKINGIYTSYSKTDLAKSIDKLLKAEAEGLKTLAESAGFENLTENITILERNKAYVNSTAVALAARRKFGFSF